MRRFIYKLRTEIAIIFFWLAVKSIPESAVRKSVADHLNAWEGMG